MYALFLKIVEPFGTYGLYLGDDDVWLVLGDYCVESLAIEHAEYFKLIGHLHGRSALIGVTSYYILAQSLGSDDKLFTQLARTEQQNLLVHSNYILL